MWGPVKNIWAIRLFSPFTPCHCGVSKVHSSLWCVNLLFTVHCFDCWAKCCMLQTTVLIGPLWDQQGNYHWHNQSPHSFCMLFSCYLDMCTSVVEGKPGWMSHTHRWTSLIISLGKWILQFTGLAGEWNWWRARPEISNPAGPAGE